MRGCLTSVKFPVFVSWRPRGKFGVSKGLKQGDPLSPFLFTLFADCLGRLMEKARNEGVIYNLWMI